MFIPITYELAHNECEFYCTKNEIIRDRNTFSYDFCKMKSDIEKLTISELTSRVVGLRKANITHLFGIIEFVKKKKYTYILLLFCFFHFLMSLLGCMILCNDSRELDSNEK